MGISDDWRVVLTAALRAPSPHNTQPWRVRVVDGVLAELFLDRTRLLDADATDCFQVSAAGIFIEAIRIAAAVRGLRVEVELHEIAIATDPAMIPVAGLRLVRDEGVASDEQVVERLASRRTARLPHTGPRLGPEALDRLVRLAESFGQHFGYTEDPTLIERALAQNTAAIFHDMNDRPYRDEFVGWLLRKQESGTRRDGMERAAMRMSAADDWVLRHAPWLLRVPVLERVLAWRYRRVIGRTDAIGWLTGPFWSFPEAVEAGRCFLRLWLAFDALGVGIHPLGNLVTNASANDWVGRELVKREGVWMVFRFGQSAAGMPSRRLPLSEVLLD